jgi:hypothetical protein
MVLVMGAIVVVIEKGILSSGDLICGNLTHNARLTGLYWFRVDSRHLDERNDKLGERLKKSTKELELGRFTGGGSPINTHCLREDGDGKLEMFSPFLLPIYWTRLSLKALYTCSKYCILAQERRNSFSSWNIQSPTSSTLYPLINETGTFVNQLYTAEGPND